MGGCPPDVFLKEDFENETGSETWNGMESHPWDPTEHGCHIVHSDLADLVSSQGTFREKQADGIIKRVRNLSNTRL